MYRFTVAGAFQVNRYKKLTLLLILLLSGGIASYYLSLDECGYMTVLQDEKMLTIYTSCDVIVTVADIPKLNIIEKTVYLTIPEDWQWRVVPEK